MRCAEALLRRRSVPNVRTRGVLLHAVSTRQLVAEQLHFIAQARGSILRHIVTGLVRLLFVPSTATVVIGLRTLGGQVHIFLGVPGVMAGKPRDPPPTTPQQPTLRLRALR